MRNTPRKADRVANDLLRKIVRGDTAVGDTLPKEQDLADSYKVNRGVVREAIKLLEVHKLVQPVKRKGTIVLDPLATLSPEVLKALLVSAEGLIDTNVLHDILEIRANLDVQMTTLAAKRRDQHELDELERIVTELEDNSLNAEVYSKAIQRAALVLARATKNRIFQMLVHWHESVGSDLYNLVRRIRKPSSAHLQGFRFLIDLIRRQDSESVGQLVAGYHNWAIPTILEEAERLNENTREAMKETTEILSGAKTS